MANGGKVNGVSHEEGGVFMNLEGGEYVIAKEAVAKNERALDYVNSGGVIEPTEIDKGGDTGKKMKISNILPNILKSPMAPLPVRAGLAIQDTFKRADALANKLEVAPIKLDVSGTIKLDSNGQQVDLNAIMNNPAFLTQLSQMIERRLADNVNGGNFKELRKNKQHSF
jgi:hypothetical protein